MCYLLAALLELLFCCMAITISHNSVHLGRSPWALSVCDACLCSVSLLPLQVCKECFYVAFETEIHETIVEHRLFKPGEKVAIGASGNRQVSVHNGEPAGRANMVLYVV